MKPLVLVIEDNPTNMDLMVYSLKSFGYEPLTATRGPQGLELARQRLPALILCDIQMPGMDGYQLAAAIKRDDALRGIPLIAVTAYAMVGDREKVLGAGFDGYIAKPIDPSELAVTLAKVLKPGEAAATAPGTASPAAPARPAHGQTILALDDKHINLELKRELLEPLGYQVITAQDIDEAMRLAHKHQPALILSDVGLSSRHDGFDFIRRIKADMLLRDTPFIFLTTTHWDIDLRDQALSLGATRFLFRPIEPAKLLAEIQACLA